MEYLTNILSYSFNKSLLYNHAGVLIRKEGLKYE